MAMSSAHNAVISCIYFFTVFSYVLTGVSERGIEVFSKNSEFCQVSGTVFFCDFKWKLQYIELEHQPTCSSNAKCDALILQRVHYLHFNTSVCVDLTLKHISKVNLQGTTRTDCSGMGLSIQNVTLDFLDDRMTSVYADESHIKQLNFSPQAGGHLTIIGSQVDVLSVPDVVGDDGSLKIHSSKIKDFKRLRIFGKGSFHLQDSTVEDFPAGSLVLDSSRRNLISGVTFAKYDEDSEASVVLTDGADITLEDIKGAVKISSAKCPLVSTSPTSSSLPPYHLTTNVAGNSLETSEDIKDVLPGKTLECRDPSSSYSWMATAVTLSISMNFLLILLMCYLLYLLAVMNSKNYQTSINKYVKDLDLTVKSSKITKDKWLSQNVPLIFVKPSNGDISNGQNNT